MKLDLPLPLAPCTTQHSPRRSPATGCATPRCPRARPRHGAARSVPRSCRDCGRRRGALRRCVRGRAGAPSARRVRAPRRPCMRDAAGLAGDTGGSPQAGISSARCDASTHGSDERLSTRRPAATRSRLPGSSPLNGSSSSSSFGRQASARASSTSRRSPYDSVRNRRCASASIRSSAQQLRNTCRAGRRERDPAEFRCDAGRCRRWPRRDDSTRSARTGPAAPRPDRRSPA